MNGYQIDFLSFTLPTGHLPKAMELLRSFDLKSQDKGLYGYKFSYTAVGCKLLFTPDRPEVHVQLSGRGCDAFDCFSLPNDAKVTRLDIAFDSFDGYYTVEDVWGCLLQDKYAGKSRTIDGYMGFAGKHSGRTVYIGSPKSDTRLRIYDKAAEQGITQKQRLDYKDWSRFELQLRGDSASVAYSEIIRLKSLSGSPESESLAIVFESYLSTMFWLCDTPQIKTKLENGKQIDVRKNHRNIALPSKQWLLMFRKYNVDRPKIVRRNSTLSNLTKYVLNSASAYKSLSLIFPDFHKIFDEKLSEVSFSEHHEELLLDFIPITIDSELAQIHCFNLPF